MIAISAYTASVMTTTIADVMVIYATMPFVAAAIGFVVNGERVSARTLIASLVALVGIIVMVASGLGSGRLLGQALSMLMTLAFAGMIVLQRRQPGASMIVVNCLGAHRLRRLRPRQFAASSPSASTISRSCSSSA